MKHHMLATLGAAFFLSAAVLPAQSPEKQLECRNRDDNGRSHACEIREMNVAPTAKLDVSAAPNGGITVKGWSQGQILVRARVEAWGETSAEAKSQLSQVKVVAGPGSVRANGPERRNRRESWSVTYEIFVPSRMDLQLDTVNGGVSIADVNGDIVATTVNGGLNLTRLAGRVKGSTTNGGINVDLDGTTWHGEGFDISTTNGGVNVNVPSGYAARFEARTTNGGLNSDLPNANVTGREWGSRRLEATTGGGGPLIKVSTTNGGVKIRRKS